MGPDGTTSRNGVSHEGTKKMSREGAKIGNRDRAGIALMGLVIGALTLAAQAGRSTLDIYLVDVEGGHRARHVHIRLLLLDVYEPPIGNARMLPGFASVCVTTPASLRNGPVLSVARNAVRPSALIAISR